MQTKPTAPTKGATAAPTKGPAPAVATVATTPAPAKVVALGAPTPNANNNAAAAMAVEAGNVCTVAVGAAVWHFVALHNAPTTCANPAAWPPLYHTGGGTSTAKPGVPQGAANLPYTTHAVCIPHGGKAVWGAVHVYPGMRPLRGSNAAASNPGNGTLVATPGPVGARCGGNPCAATVALAKTHGLG